jgi:hypothetical protein
VRDDDVFPDERHSGETGMAGLSDLAGILSFAMAAKAFGDEKLFDQIRAYADEFERSEPR